MMKMECLSPLAVYALKGLNNAWMPEQRCWSHAFRPQIASPNISVPSSDVYYSLNVLLGLSRLPDKGKCVTNETEEIFNGLCHRMLSLPVRVYAYGMALWAAAELGFELSGPVIDKIDSLLRNEKSWSRWRAQDVGLLISGLSNMAVHSKRWEKPTESLKKYSDRYLSSAKSGLFYDSATSLRRQFSTFATHVYMMLANFHYGESFGHDPSIRRALECVDALSRVQGAHGEWPWFYHTPSGRVMDMYPVYSVHQDGMAPAYLHYAILHAHSTARNQIIKGFEWVFGENEMGVSMLSPDYGIIHRSQMRNEYLGRYKRAFRAIAKWISRAKAMSVGAGKLKINMECRSYHLGWILWSFGGRNGFPELTHHDSFSS